MSVIQVPTGLSVATLTWRQQRNDVEHRSMFGAQAQEASGPLWSTSLTSTSKRPELWQAMLMQLRGKTNQLALWNMGRPQPIGTMRGAMTLGTTAQGATSLVITAAGQAAKTLLVGDYLGVGSGLTQQVVMVCADATSNGSGVITVTTEPALRNAFASSSSVTWYRPCALFRRKDSVASWDYEPGGIVKGMSLDLLEDPRP
jgi:hypothetical protein